MKKIFLSLFVVIVGVLFVGSIADAKPQNGKGSNGFPAPSSLTAVAVSESQIDLNWSDNTRKEDGFKVERSQDGVSFNEVASVGENVASYSDTGLQSETTYNYRVRAYKTRGNKIRYSDYSNVASATTNTPLPAIPATPSNLMANAMESGGGSTSTTQWINLGWTDNTDNEDGFKVEKSTDGVTFALFTIVGANVTIYDDYFVDPSTTYYYRINAFNPDGSSDYSNVASATTQ